MDGALSGMEIEGAKTCAGFWGHTAKLDCGDRFRVRRIEVQRGEALTMRSHLHRSEHWVVVRGTARVTLGNAVRLVAETQSITVPLGTLHGLENPGRLPLILIAVETGTYLGEDDLLQQGA